MNSTQILVTLISGYEPMQTSAKDDGYYDIIGAQEKLHYLLDFVMGHDEIKPDVNIFLAFHFMKTDFKNENEKYHAFCGLGTN